MNQIKYAAYALLLVLGVTSVALFVNNLSFPNSSFSETQITSTVGSPAAATVVNVAGKNLFQANCQSCHALNKALTGPALAGVEGRGPWADRKNLVNWVKNPAATVNAFPYTKDLLQQYSGQLMPSFPQLDEKQIESIFDYIKEAGTPN